MSVSYRQTFALLSGVIALGIASCGTRTDSRANTRPAPVEVRTARAVTQPLARTFEAGGIVRARMTAHLTSRIVAEVREVRVEPGQRVRRGQVLAVLDDRDLRARQAQAGASLSAAEGSATAADAAGETADARVALARTSHQRIAQLREKNSATPQELDQVTAELRMAESGVRAARARQGEAAAAVVAARAAREAAGVAASFSVIAAPFDGLVTHKLIEPGNMASPGVPLLAVESSDGFRLDIQVDEARARFVRAGHNVVVECDSDEQGSTMRGRVDEVSQGADASTHSFVVKVGLPAAATVRSGMFARARFETVTREALVVPASAMVRRGQLSLVFAIDGDGRARMRAITAGERSGDSVEVLAGVQAGEIVILNPPAFLADGTAVRVAGGRP